KQMRLDGQEEQGGSGEKWALPVEMEKKRETEQQERRGLPAAKAGNGGSEEQGQGIVLRARIEQVNGKDDACGECDDPKALTGARAEEAEGRNKKKGPRRIAHHERARGQKAGGFFERENAARRIGAYVVDEQLRSAPVGDVVHVRRVDASGEYGGSGECDESDGEDASEPARRGAGRRRCFNCGSYFHWSESLSQAFEKVATKIKRNLVLSEVPLWVGDRSFD